MAGVEYPSWAITNGGCVSVRVSSGTVTSGDLAFGTAVSGSCATRWEYRVVSDSTATTWPAIWQAAPTATWQWSQADVVGVDGHAVITYDGTGALYYCPPPVPKTPAERIAEILRERSAPFFTRRGNDFERRPLSPARDFRELRARDLLARVVGADKYRQFVRDGFLSVRGRSGLTYQLYQDGRTRVWRDGKMIDRWCVVLAGDFPRSDALVARYLLALNDEDRFRALAVKSGGLVETPVAEAADGRTLPEIYRELTGRRAG